MPFKLLSINTSQMSWGVVCQGVITSDYSTVVWVCHIGTGLLVVAMVACCMQTCLMDDGLALCTNKNADMQIRSSQGPSIGLVEGPHEGVYVGTQYVNGVLCISVHHLREGVHECHWKLASLEEVAVCKRPGVPKLIRPRWADFFPS